MSSILNIGVIGLGVMGQRMLERIRSHPRLNACLVWDEQPDAIARTLQIDPRLRPSHSAQELIASPGLHGLYIATPPAAHLALSHLAFDAGLAVLCEKPLTVDFEAAQIAIQRIERESLRAAVNFSLASSPALTLLQQRFGNAAHDGLSSLKAVQIELGFAAWPRPWQSAAGAWLSERAEGGFTREVLSHFIFALQRVLGPASVLKSEAEFPPKGEGAETALHARLRAGGVDISVDARVDAEIAVPDRNCMRWLTSDGEIELREWFSQARQRQGQGQDWQTLGDAADLRATGQLSQLDQWVHLIEDRPHGLPGYAEALAVQQTIEALLSRD